MKMNILLGVVAVALVIVGLRTSHESGASALKQTSRSSVTPTPPHQTKISSPQATTPVVAEVQADVDPQAAARALMLARLGFGTNGGHAVTVYFAQKSN